MYMEKQEVLIVDDDEINLKMLSSICKKDWKTYTANTADHALKLLGDVKPDIILLDVVMPGIDGFELCSILKKRRQTKNIPIFFITADTDKVNEKKGLSVGAVDYLTKPFNAEVVKSRIRNQLELEKYRKNLEHLVKLKTLELENTKEALIAAMAIMAEYRDNDTGMHIKRTGYYFKCLACRLKEKFPEKLNDNNIDLMSQSATLHDIGKVGITDKILLKCGDLTGKEYNAIKNHTLIGRDILKRTEEFIGPSKFLRFAREIVEFHHERYDGAGYPHGIKGEEIPLSAQIMSIIDVYDALRSKRPYKKAMSHKEAVKIITIGDDRIKPSFFSPLVLNAFIECASNFEYIHLELQEKKEKDHSVNTTKQTLM